MNVAKRILTEADCNAYDGYVRDGKLSEARIILSQVSEPLPEMSKRLRGEMEHYVECAMDDGQLRSEWEALQMLDEDSVDKDHFSHALRPELRRIKKALGIECFSEKETFGAFWTDEEIPVTLAERQYVG